MNQVIMLLNWPVSVRLCVYMFTSILLDIVQKLSGTDRLKDTLVQQGVHIVRI